METKSLWLSKINWLGWLIAILVGFTAALDSAQVGGLHVPGWIICLAGGVTAAVIPVLRKYTSAPIDGANWSGLGVALLLSVLSYGSTKMIAPSPVPVVAVAPATQEVANADAFMGQTDAVPVAPVVASPDAGPALVPGAADAGVQPGTPNSAEVSTPVPAPPIPVTEKAPDKIAVPAPAAPATSSTPSI